MTTQKLAGLRRALQAAEAEAERLAGEVAAAEEELRQEAEEARRRAAEERIAAKALGQRVTSHFEQASAPELAAEAEAEPARLREESVIRWAVHELRETAAFGHVFAQVPERLHGEVERRYEEERATWEAEQGGRMPELEAALSE